MDEVDQKQLIKLTVEMEDNFIPVSNETGEVVREITGTDPLANY